MTPEEQLISDILVLEEKIDFEISLTESLDGEEITKLKIRQMNAVNDYAKQKAVEFGKHIRLKEMTSNWRKGQTYEQIYDEFNTNNK